MHDFPVDIEDFDKFNLLQSSSLSSTFHVFNTVSSSSSAGLTPVTTWSSDDIPLVLYDEAYARYPSSSWDASCSSASLADESGDRNSVISETHFGASFSLPPGGAVRLLTPSRRSSADRIPDVPRSAASSFIDSSSALQLKDSGSSATITSLGTFGQRKKSIDAGVQVIIDEENVFRGQRTSAKHLTGLFARTRASAAGDRYSLKIETDSHNDGEPSRFISTLSTDNSESQDILYCEDYDDGEEPETPTPMKPVPNSVSWISSRNWNSQQYKDYIAREGLALSPVLQISNIDSSEDRSLHRATPTKPKALIENHDKNDILDTPRASRYPRAQAAQEPDEEQSRRQFPVKETIRQEHYTWLKDITVQILIDQEGFRSARPSFMFTGVARLRSAHGTKAPGALMAQFRPVARETFHFHYAPFETPPILRRVTVDFDEMHDYLTRQALLTLKSNGVYVLHGHETSSFGNETESVKLHWRLEYLVDDRRVEGKVGRPLEGEKLLIPLTFSCTPAFVLASQGKRNTVMHVFKKGVAPKLVAEKMQPPSVPRPSNPTSSNSPTESGGSRFFSSKIHTWHLHKRGQSHSVREQAKGDSHRPRLPLPDSSIEQYRETEKNSQTTPHVRRRRASSAGENQKLAPLSPLTPVGNQHRTAKFAIVQQAIATPSRHILSPAKLNEMLDAPFSPASPTGSVPAHTPPRNSASFTPLTPRPRHSSYPRDFFRAK